jgi:hypothetical protein
MAIDDPSRMLAIRKAIEILQQSSGRSSKNKSMHTNESNYVVNALMDAEKQLQVDQDEPTGTA